VGYALFWPGILAALASVAVIVLGYRGVDLPPEAIPPLLLQVCAGAWGLYTVIAALRARHGFGWGRAVLAYLLPFVAIAIVVVAVVIAASAV
jgi:hypothetical protein